MLTDDTTFEALTRLTRLAQLREGGERWLERTLSRRRLERLAEPAVEVAVATGDPIGRVLAGRLGDEEVSGALVLRLLARIHRLDARRSVPLREVALVVTELARDVLLRAVPGGGDPVREAALAGLAQNRSHWLANLGWREEALSAAEEAVPRWRRLAADDPEHHRPALARALDGLGQRLVALGRFEAAFEAFAEAVDLARRLVADDPVEHRPSLARSVANLSLVLRSLERREEALDAAREAMDLYRDLARERPEAFRADLALAAHNLAAQEMRAGRLERALKRRGWQGQAERRVGRATMVTPSRGVVRRQWLVLAFPHDHESAQGQACVRLREPGISEVLRSTRR